MNIEKRRAEIAARKAEIRKLLTDDKNADIDALEKELRELNEEDAGLEKRQAIERMLNSGSATGNPIENPVAARSLPVEDTEKLYRSAWLKTLQGKSLTDDEKRVYEQRAYSTAANSALPIIPETTANQIIKKMYEVAPILQRCKIFHVPGNFKFAVEGTNSDAALHTENASITAASDSLTSVSLTGYEIVKLVKASRASSEMALSAFESYIVEVIAESIARKIENYIFTGTGSDQPGGVKVAGKGTSGAYTDGTDQVTVAKTASLTEENVVSLYGSSEYVAAIRQRLRLTTDDFDNEITDLIIAARADLALGGVVEEKANDETDPLILKAVETYVKAEFGLDNDDAERYRASYKEQRNGLTLSDKYIVAEGG